MSSTLMSVLARALRVDFAIEFLSSYKKSKYISNIEVYLLDKLFGWMVCAYFRTRTLR
jgi:hypothetical protein